MAGAVHLRAARREDARALALLVDIAGEGLPRIVWEGMREPGEGIFDVGERRAAREEGSFSYRNAIVAEDDGGVLAALVGYPLAETPDPVDPEDIPALFRPLQALEDLAGGTWYINVLASFPEARNRGLGARLIDAARAAARDCGCERMSLIVQDANPARRLYARAGFSDVARRPIVREGGWDCPGQDWVLQIADV
ncbi:GNAT family N-acetyltransferase [Oceanibium sediminis]|uniref:GNAT family N-acetyltransferase n=1 Tax=Oceanibium sediminis TaxID=2026339 RepID=UPI000DD4E6FD|nr:GNAT family N-acetyltransferase [Oceanibium sediminis]